MVTDDDIGLKVLREASEGENSAQIIDIVAIHGLGAHPDESWRKNIGTTEGPKWCNWLIEDEMLPAVAPHARIMRYGYQSAWFGKESMQSSVPTVADRLLRALRRRRKDVKFRQLLFIAHCFGGLIVLRALLEAEQDQSEWSGLFLSTTGLIFFGTPFRGAEGMTQMEMLEAARREYDEDQVQHTALQILQPGNVYLKDLVDSFLKKLRSQVNKTRIACFFELKSSNVGRIVGKQDRMRFVVSESSGCLDLSESTSKYSLSRTHFNMNKFGNAEEEDFETVAEVIEDMIKESPKLILARSQPHNGKHKIDFSLRDIPVVNQFVRRDTEMRELERAFAEKPAAKSRRRVVVLYGLGGIGKTQLAVEFAREYHCRFSSVIWLDGSSDASLKQSFAGMAQRLQQDELTTDVAEMKHPAINVDVAVRECLRWLSLPSNRHWLLIFDNVDRDFYNQDDQQAYNVKAYFPDIDHGSILITSRLASLQRHGLGIKVGTVETEQARAILENNAGKVINDVDMILQRLSGLPLALTQAGSFIQATNMSASTYSEHYDKTWERLMQRQGQFPLEEYGDRNVLTTWTISYEQVLKQSEKAAWLLKLWGFLDHKELWYELVAAGLRLSKDFNTPTWLLEIAEDELAYAEAVGLLSRYSLADAREGSNSHSMHSVLHQWCGQLVEGEEQYILGLTAAGIVASNKLDESEAEFWKKRKRLLGHAISVSQWIVKVYLSEESETGGGPIKARIFFALGYILAGEDQLKEAEAMYEQALRRDEKILGPEHESTLSNFNALGSLYKHQGRLQEAEAMYERALQGYEKTLGSEHRSTLRIVNNLGVLYMIQVRLQEAEAMYERALQGYEKTLGLEHGSTLDIVSNLGGLYKHQGRLQEAEAMCERALQGYEKTLGSEHRSTLRIVNNLGRLYKHQGRLQEAKAMYERALQGYEKTLGSEHRSTLRIVNNLSKLYRDLGRFQEAEAMYKQALRGYEKVIKPEIIPVYLPALDTMKGLASLFDHQHQVEDARAWYSKALPGYENVFGRDHSKCQSLRNKLAVLDKQQDEIDQSGAEVSV